MTPGPRDYTRVTLKRLHTLSMNECACPDCDRALIGWDGLSIVSKICHIEAASSDGPRWNPDMTDDDRRHFNNLILLCDECHTIVDNLENESVYTVELLRKWKNDHESAARSKVLTARPTLLGMVIDAIALADLDEDPGLPPEGMQAFGIDDKIEYNCVHRNRVLIDEFKVYYTKVNSLYEALEDGGSFKKESLLRNIRRIYLGVKGKYVGDSGDPMQVVRERADDIIDDVQDRLLSVVETNNSSSVEDVDVAIALVMVDAFMRCKILEAPPT